jgi:hypothetical protein
MFCITLKSLFAIILTFMFLFISLNVISIIEVKFGCLNEKGPLWGFEPGHSRNKLRHSTSLLHTPHRSR